MISNPEVPLSKPLRVMLYDDTCRRSSLGLGLTHSWIVGGELYKWRRKLDLCQGASSWEEGLAWLATVAKDNRIAEIQFWGHGKWGMAMINRAPMDISALEVNHPLNPYLLQIRAALIGPNARWWFRTCETIGAHSGQAFARAWADFFGCKISGHTHIIGPWQSGLYTLNPGQTPDWDPEAGILEGDADDPRVAVWSKHSEPRTISCLRADVPAQWG